MPKTALVVDCSLLLGAALDSIAKDPTRFQPVGQDIRIFRLKRYPYYPSTSKKDQFSQPAMAGGVFI